MTADLTVPFPSGRVPVQPAVEAPRFYSTEEHHAENGTLLGFWLYLMSDCLVFACLFAAYGVLGRSYAAGPTGADLFDLPLVAIIVHTFNYQRDFYIPSDEVVRIENDRTRMLLAAGHV
jgi:cytochrome o ubiquinol oxidase subunit 3